MTFSPAEPRTRAARLLRRGDRRHPPRRPRTGARLGIRRAASSRPRPPDGRTARRTPSPVAAKLQPTLMRRSSRIFLAGDYLGTLYTEIRHHHRLLRRPGSRQPAGHRAPAGAPSRPSLSRRPASHHPDQSSTPRKDILIMTSTLRGVLVALATPFAADGGVDEARLRALVDRTIDGGVHGVVACGSTGEFSALTRTSDGWWWRPSSTRPPAGCRWSRRPAPPAPPRRSRCRGTPRPSVPTSSCPWRRTTSRCRWPRRRTTCAASPARSTSR